MKNKIVSVCAVLILVVAVAVAAKMGVIDIFSQTPNASQQYADNSGNNGLSDGESSSANEETVVFDSKNEEDSVMINKGEEGIYEYLSKDAKGNVTNASSRYSFRYIDCTVSQSAPDGLDRENAVYHSILIKNENGEPATDENGRPTYDEPEVDADGNFIDDTYYVTVTYEVTNLMEDGWDKDGVHPQNFIIGYIDERDNFQYVTEPLGNIYGKANYRGSVILEKDENVIITNCYDVKKEVLDTHQLVVKMENSGNAKGASIPYFVIDDNRGETE